MHHSNHHNHSRHFPCIATVLSFKSMAAITNRDQHVECVHFYLNYSSWHWPSSSQQPVQQLQAILGTEPIQSVLRNCSFSGPLISQTSGGIDPSKFGLMWIQRSTKLSKSPSSEGIVPTTELRLNFRPLRFVAFPIFVLRVPSMLH